MTAYVILIRYEHPFSAGFPTSLPKISTLWVLPSPPGRSNVFIASRWLHRQMLEIRDAEPEHEVGLIQAPEDVQARALRRPRHAGEIDVRGDVTLAGLLEEIGRLRVVLEAGKRARCVRPAVQLGGLMTVVDDHHEPLAQGCRRIRNPVFSGEVHLGAPPACRTAPARDR